MSKIRLLGHGFREEGSNGDRDISWSSLCSQPGALGYHRQQHQSSWPWCREEGSNGDREMAAAVHAAGLEPWDITMSDLLMRRATLDSFTGIVFVGGFSYADVLDSAKGWAGTIRRNAQLWQQFQAFYDRCSPGTIAGSAVHSL